MSDVDDKIKLSQIIVEHGKLLPFYKVDVICGDLFTFLSPRLLDEDRELWCDMPYYPGIYCFYQSKKECLYVGQTDYSIYNRIYRFMKELLDRSRSDESHSAARKARLDGISSDEIYMKYMSKYDIKNLMDCANINVSLDDIDEYIAYTLKSRYNVRVKPWLIRPAYNSLLNFFEDAA